MPGRKFTTEEEDILDAAHRQGWNAALAEVEKTTRDQLDAGQKVTREDIIRTARALADNGKLLSEMTTIDETTSAEDFWARYE